MSNSNKNRKSININWLFHYLKLQEQRVINGIKCIYGHQAYRIGSCIENNYLIITANKKIMR